MRRESFLILLVLVLCSLMLSVACVQEQGERCQRDDDCSGALECVGSSDVGTTGASGHCCPDCPGTGAPFWDTESGDGNVGVCGCTSSSTDGDADADSDGDADGDADSDADGDADSDADADGDVESDADLESADADVEA